jgi:ribonucleoside-diphosphate reductase alpha chain
VNPADAVPSLVATRRLLPNRRHCTTTKIKIAGQSMYISAGEYDDGTLGEIFLTMSKAGSALRGLLDALAITFSLALQHGVPLACLVAALKNMRFEPAGDVIGSAEIERASSPVDFIAKQLEALYLVPPPAPAVEKVAGEYQQGSGV